MSVGVSATCCEWDATLLVKLVNECEIYSSLSECSLWCAVFVETLDRCFKNVCELDIVFNFNKVGARCYYFFDIQFIHYLA